MQPFDAPAAVRAAGLDYLNIPVSHTPLDDRALEDMQQALHEVIGARRAFVYCNSGNRVGAALIPHLMLDRDGQETIVMNSGLDWTVFKPPRLMNGAERPGTQVGPDLMIGPAARTTVRSLATAILGELLASQFVRKAVFIKS